MAAAKAAEVAAAARVAQVAQVVAAAQAAAAAAVGITAATIEAAAAAAQVAQVAPAVQVAQAVQVAAVAGTAVTMITIAASVTIEIAVPRAAVTTPQAAATPQGAAATPQGAAAPRAGLVIVATIKIATVTAIMIGMAIDIVTATTTATTPASLTAIMIVIVIAIETVIDIAAGFTSPRIMATTDIAPTLTIAPTRMACSQARTMLAADKVMIRSAHTFTGVETTAFSPSSVSGTRTSRLTGMAFCAATKKATTTIRIISVTGAFIVNSIKAVNRKS